MAKHCWYKVVEGVECGVVEPVSRGCSHLLISCQQLASSVDYSSFSMVHLDPSHAITMLITLIISGWKHKMKYEGFRVWKTLP
jgi:hypothetical protein